VAAVPRRALDTVELNNSFYRLPSATAVRAWRATLPRGVLFAVKASRFLTHLKRLEAPARSLGLFLRRAHRLQDALGPVLFQLPEHFHANPERLDHRRRRSSGWPARTSPPCLHDWRVCPVTGPVTADFVSTTTAAAPRRGTRGGCAGCCARVSLSGGRPKALVNGAVVRRVTRPAWPGGSCGKNRSL
jgi:hypothetical protein